MMATAKAAKENELRDVYSGVGQCSLRRRPFSSLTLPPLGSALPTTIALGKNPLRLLSFSTPATM
jgi:uncharacterized NAD-dependent epimerase/dehydratase family protein